MNASKSLQTGTSSSRMSGCTRAGCFIPICISPIIADSKVNEFIKPMHKRRLPSNLEPETPPPRYEGREQLAKAICSVYLFAIGKSNNAYNIRVFKGGIAP